LSNPAIKITGCSYRIEYEISKIFVCLFLNYFDYSVTVPGQNTQFSLKGGCLCTQSELLLCRWVGLACLRLDISAFKWGSKHKTSTVTGEAH